MDMDIARRMQKTILIFIEQRTQSDKIFIKTSHSREFLIVMHTNGALFCHMMFDWKKKKKKREKSHQQLAPNQLAAR